MKKLIFKLTLVLGLAASLFSLSPLNVLAINCSNPTTAKQQIQCGACDAAGGSASCNPASAPQDISDTIKTAIEVISVIAGAVAVIMIVFGGFRYVTSAGNAEATKSARNTIVYAVIGLIIIALAQIIVHFVLTNTTAAGSGANNKPAAGSSASPADTSNARQ